MLNLSTLLTAFSRIFVTPDYLIRDVGAMLATLVPNWKVGKVSGTVWSGLWLGGWNFVQIDAFLPFGEDDASADCGAATTR